MALPAPADVIDQYPAWHKQYYSPAFGDPSVYSFPGNINEAKSATHPAIRQPVASCPASQLNSGGLCTTNINGLNEYSDPAQRVNMYSQGRLKINANTTAFAEVSYSQTKTTYQTLPYANQAGSACASPSGRSNRRGRRSRSSGVTPRTTMW